MSFKNITYITAYLILPLILLSLGSSFGNLTRIYVTSGEFIFSIYLGAFVTTLFYTQFLSSKKSKIIVVTLLGVLTPLLYTNAAYKVYGSGIEEHDALWSLVYFVTTQIGSIEIILYIGIIVQSFIELIKRFIKLLYNFFGRI